MDTELRNSEKVALWTASLAAAIILHDLKEETRNIKEITKDLYKEGMRVVTIKLP